MGINCYTTPVRYLNGKEKKNWEVFYFWSRLSKNKRIILDNVTVVRIVSKKDVTKNDIIKYFNNVILHYAVVFKTREHTSKQVFCFVAHYNASVGSALRMKEAADIVIWFRESFYKFDFASSQFEVLYIIPTSLWNIHNIGWVHRCLTSLAMITFNFPFGTNPFFDNSTLAFSS